MHPQATRSDGTREVGKFLSQIGRGAAGGNSKVARPWATKARRKSSKRVECAIDDFVHGVRRTRREWCGGRELQQALRFGPQPIGHRGLACRFPCAEGLPGPHSTGQPKLAAQVLHGVLLRQEVASGLHGVDDVGAERFHAFALGELRARDAAGHERAVAATSFARRTAAALMDSVSAP